MLMISRVVFALALGVAQAVFAQTSIPQSAESGGGIPLGLSQKLVFARSMIEDPSVAKRVQASKDAEAQRLLALAVDSYSSALVAIKGGDFAAAEKFLNEVMSTIGKARRRVPDKEALEVKQRTDYQRLLESIESLQKSYLSYQKRAKQPSGVLEGKTETSANLDVAKLVDAAKMQSRDGHWGDALQSLEHAELVMKSSLGQLLGLTLLEFPQKFNTLVEEYAFELECNRNFLGLIPVAIEELKPTEDAKQTIEGLVEQDRASIDLAGEYAKLQDYNKALANIRTGTDFLRLALSTAGLVLSKGPGAE